MIVLDSSALVDVVADQPAKAGVLDTLTQPIVAPAHQPAETLSAVARLLRAGALSKASARAALADVASLEQELVPLDDDLLLRALALDGNLRVLDASTSLSRRDSTARWSRPMRAWCERSLRARWS